MSQSAAQIVVQCSLPKATKLKSREDRNYGCIGNAETTLLPNVRPPTYPPVIPDKGIKKIWKAGCEWVQKRENEATPLTGISDARSHNNGRADRKRKYRK